jgi:hypothetical protein
MLRSLLNMNMKRKSLVAALMGAGALAASGAANAVYVNGDGLGQVLIYPYYTVRSGNATLMSLVNTTDQGKVVKVRFREGKNSADVLDFLVFMSPKDVWTGAVTSTADNGNGTGGAKLTTRDTSCVFPTVDEFGNQMRGNGIPFRNFGYTGATFDDAETDDVDRVREGYIEVIETATVLKGSDLYDDILHDSGVKGSVPRTPDCAIVDSGALIGASGTTNGLYPPSGGLFGNGTTINVGGGTNTGYDALALDEFWDPVTEGQVFAASSESPNLGEANPISVVTDGNATFVTQWGAGILAVGATIMHSNIMNEYAFTADKFFATDWVVTMPTKRQHVNGATAPIAPFQRKFVKGGACDDVNLNAYDREEGFSTSRPGFSPPPPTGTNSLCWEANVISFGGLNGGVSSVYGSTNALGYVAYQNNGAPVGGAGAPAQGEGGWLDMSFATGTGVTNGHAMIGGSTATVLVDGPVVTTGQQASVTFRGLPVIGFAIVQGNAAQIASFASSYGHRYKRNITPRPVTIN